LLCEATAVMVRFLDNVLDVTEFPTSDQRDEALSKRRIGLGYTGLANALQMLGIGYGSHEAVDMTDVIGRAMATCAYRTSIALAKERGEFPKIDRARHAEAPFVRSLPSDIETDIRNYGIRNGVILSIAPVGTNSLFANNVSSGCEPVFAHRVERDVISGAGIKDKRVLEDYGYAMYQSLHRDFSGRETDLPAHFVTVKDMTVGDHVRMMAAAQRWIDASISKTINCPADMTFDHFRDVYAEAYAAGLKSCTTYRPNPESGRGAVVVDATDVKVVLDDRGAIAKETSDTVPDKVPMQEVASGKRYRLKWPHDDNALYVQIFDYVDHAGVRRPNELFLSSKSVRHEEWLRALSLLVTAIFRRGGDASFIIEELRSVYSARGGAFVDRRYEGSIVAAIGSVIERHMRDLGLLVASNVIMAAPEPEPCDHVAAALDKTYRETCDECGAPSVVRKDGCRTCYNCGHSDCG
jgi:ribonucleoside-diphosphate reductase alpha chain